MRKIFLLRKLVLFSSFAFVLNVARAQYFDPTSYMLQMQLQQQMQQIQQSTTQQLNNFYYKIKPSIDYYTTDCKTLKIRIQLDRNISFSNVSCYISDMTNRKFMSLKHDMFAGDIILDVGKSDWSLEYGDIITINYDDNKKWTYTLGEGMSSVDWSRYCQNQLIVSIKEYKKDHQKINNTYTNKRMPQNSIPYKQNSFNQNSVTSTNTLKINQINNQIEEEQRKLEDAQNSLSLYEGWYDKDPSITLSNLIQSQKRLVNNYNTSLNN